MNPSIDAWIEAYRAVTETCCAVRRDVDPVLRDRPLVDHPRLLDAGVCVYCGNANRSTLEPFVDHQGCRHALRCVDHDGCLRVAKPHWVESSLVDVP